VLDLVGDTNEFRDIPLGYGASAGLPELRQVIAKDLGVSDDWVVTTSGSALGLFLVAMELCRAGDRAVAARPSSPPTRDTLKGSGAELIEVPLAFFARLSDQRLALRSR
jgi:DNA-binding transcriptional MocR family regulator